MAYFSLKDHEALLFSGGDDSGLQLVYDKFMELHRSLHRRLRDHNFDLHPHGQPANLISNRSATCIGCSDALSLPYFRSREQAQLVERLMGRDHNERRTEVDTYRHPVIELRITPEHFAVELVLSPNAWWDQQNLVGKLAIPRHRETLRGLFQRLDGDYCFGFWDGAELGDMYVTTRQVARSTYLYEWMSTFADGQDWLRLGVWYEPEDPALDTGRILSEIVRRIGSLYSVYTFLLWTSNNDYHAFYHKTVAKTVRVHHA